MASENYFCARAASAVVVPLETILLSGLRVKATPPPLIFSRLVNNVKLFMASIIAGKTNQKKTLKKTKIKNRNKKPKTENVLTLREIVFECMPP